MELLKDRVNKVYFEGEGVSNVTGATYSIDGAAPVALNAPYRVSNDNTSPNYELWYTTAPYVNQEGTLDITWEFSIEAQGTFTHTDRYEVVTPLLTIREVKSIVPTATTEEAIELEAAVRHIIQAHCGQTFGFRSKTLVVPGDGSGSLRLPERLIRVTSVMDPVYEYAIQTFSIRGDGWYLKKVVPTPYTDSLIKYAMPEEYTNPIHYPYGNGVYTTYRQDVNYEITGDWGYESIPNAVQEAARILVEDYSCMESQYRDKFIKTMTSGDWRFEFNAGAYTKTGNVRADQLLDAYVVTGWLVV